MVSQDDLPVLPTLAKIAKALGAKAKDLLSWIFVFFLSLIDRTESKLDNLLSGKLLGSFHGAREGVVPAEGRSANSGNPDILTRVASSKGEKMNLTPSTRTDSNILTVFSTVLPHNLLVRARLN